MDLPAPFIPLSTLPNLRSVGLQHTTPSSKVVRPDIIYRSVDPSNLSASDLVHFRDVLGIRTLFDLRSLPEIEKANAEAGRSGVRDYAKDSLRREWVPIFAAEDYSPEKVALRFGMYGRGVEVRKMANSFSDLGYCTSAEVCT